MRAQSEQKQQDTPAQLSLPELRTWIVRRMHPLEEKIQELVVYAHLCQCDGKNLMFVTFTPFGDGDVQQRSTRGFSEWLDYEEKMINQSSNLIVH